jgi:LacI family transcriptional regulator, galactose operon repressor
LHNRLSEIIMIITMQDIADKAGVSKGTVSYVLNGKQEKARINQETCARVIAIAESLGYRRNAIAQSMKTGKTNVIGLVGGLDGEYVLKIIRGINDVVSKNNYMIKLLPTETTEEVKNASRQCVEQRLAGVICRSLSEKELQILRKELEPNNIPIVLVDSSVTHDWSPRVISDDATGTKMAVEHLAELGHTRIAYLGSRMTSGFAILRKAGFRQGMKECSLTTQEDNICITESNYKKADDFIRFNDDFTRFYNKFHPTAIVCASDPLAMKLLQWTYKYNIRVPDDLSIVGFANLNYSAISSPALTTVAQPFNQMGARTAKKIIELINGNCNEMDEFLPVKLIIRGSTTIPRKNTIKL